MNKPLSIHEFKNWLSKQPDMESYFELGARDDQPKPEKKYEQYVGRTVVAKVSQQKLLQRIETEEDVNDIIDEFLDVGGKVSDVEGKNVIIETEAGMFSIPRFCVALKKDD